jgi:ABC-type multidrug transport system fused ATPase/permease subunit
MNYVYFFNAITKAEIAGVVINFRAPLPKINFYSNDEINWVNQTGSYFLWIILVAQILVYAWLTILVENAFHGNNRRGRDFDSSPGALDSQAAIQTRGLSKHYRPSWFGKICCCARTPKTKAVDSLDLTSYRHQILCLLGPNGSGKTTTLDMLAGFQTPTDGSITINASPSQIGTVTHTSSFYVLINFYCRRLPSEQCSLGQSHCA